jgi:hypothetical protein
MVLNYALSESGFDLGGYFTGLGEIGLSRHASDEKIDEVAERELKALDANKPNHGVELRELREYFSERCRLGLKTGD